MVGSYDKQFWARDDSSNKMIFSFITFRYSAVVEMFLSERNQSSQKGDSWVKKYLIGNYGGIPFPEALLGVVYRAEDPYLDFAKFYQELLER